MSAAGEHQGAAGWMISADRRNGMRACGIYSVWIGSAERDGGIGKETPDDVVRSMGAVFASEH